MKRQIDWGLGDEEVASDYPLECSGMGNAYLSRLGHTGQLLRCVPKLGWGVP